MTARLGALALGGATLVAALGLAGLRHLPADPPLSVVEDLLIDLRFALRGPRAAPAGALVVAIDDPALAEIGLMAPMRDALAEIAPRLAAAGAAAVVVDLLLVEPTEADGRLAAALAASPETILAVAGGASAAPPSPALAAALRASAFPIVAGRPGVGAAAAPGALAPTGALLGGSALGHVNVALSPDRVARRAALALDLPDGVALPAAALVAARRALGLPAAELALLRGQGVGLGPRLVATDREGLVLLNHYGGPGAIETVGLSALRAGAVDPARIAGRVVFVGAAAESLRDVFATPFAPDVAGVELLATLATNLIHDDLIAEGGRLAVASAGLALAGAALAGIAIALPASPLAALVGSLAVAAAVAAALQAAFAADYALDAVTALGALALAAAAHWLRRLRRDRAGALGLAAERARLAGYLSPFAASVMPGAEAGPAWRTEDATVCFADVEGSVGLAEARSPAETAALLAAVQGRIARAATRHGGAVVERFGDGALVVFGFGGAGGPREALAFARELALAPAAGPRLRVSLQHGPVALADLGGGVGGHVTVAGDTVNVAARLQEAAKRAAAPIVVGRAVLDAAGVDLAGVGLRALAPEPVRGRREGVEAWALGG